jgi:hypothetical protein
VARGWKRADGAIAELIEGHLPQIEAFAITAEESLLVLALREQDGA